ncbi:MAG: LapA family protein [Gaiellaceae bacterium]
MTQGDHTEDSAAEPSGAEPQPAMEPVEARGARLRRQGHHAGLYAWAVVLVALLVVVIALVVANTRQVKLNWVVGKGNASLVWIVVAATILGWLLGIATSVVFRLRTRRRD